ncbi:MAG: SurA N-terminal domain-containing protein [Pseudomonadales bacterium]|nr:SurA N-terminal domain-containing protein [Pseudomonadales bacterium]
MLQNIRDNMQGAIAYGIVGLVIVTFGLFGVEALFMQGGMNRDSVAEVNGKEVKEIDLRRAMEMQKQQFRSMMGDKIDPRFLEDDFIRGPSLDNLVRRNVLVSEAEKKKMTVSSKVLDEKIVSDKTFRPGGQFDREYYTELLASSGFSPMSYREQLRGDYVVNQLQKGITLSSFIVEQQVDDMVELLHQKRSFSYIRLPLELFNSDITVDDQEINDYYSANQDRYLSEESVKVNYVLLSKKDLLPLVDIHESDILDQYQIELENFESNIERHAAHILIEEKADGSHQKTIAEISEKLKSGEDFADLAKAYSVDVGSAESGGDVGYSKGDIFVPEFEEALSSLEVGAVSEPVKTQFGYHFIKLLDKQQGEPPTLEESRKRIERELQAALVETLYVEKLEQMKNVSYDAGNLDDVALAISGNGFQAKKMTSDAFGRMGTSGPFRNPSVISTAFSGDFLEGTINSDVLELSESEALVMRLVEHNQPKILPLEDVRENVSAYLVSEKAKQKAEAKARELESLLQAGNSMEQVASENGFEWQLALDKERNSSGVDRQILEAVFRLAKPEGAPVTHIETLPSGDQVLISFTEVTTGEASVTEEQRAAIKRQLQQAAERQDMAMVEAVMRSRADIKQRKAKE